MYCKYLRALHVYAGYICRDIKRIMATFTTQIWKMDQIDLNNSFIKLFKFS